MSILQEIQDVAKNEVDLYFQHKIYQKLAVVMKQVFNLNTRLSDIENFFILNEQRFNEFVYDFIGNKVQLYFLSGLKLVVYLSDNHTFNSPFGAFCCHIEVDDDLNYQSATFQARFNFGRTKTYHSDNTYSSLFLDRAFDKDFNYSAKIGYSLLGFNSGGITFDSTNLPAIFFENDNDFFTPLMKVLDACSNNQAAFYDIFEEYPYHETMIEDVDQFKSFLMMYHSQYIKDAHSLNSRILLLAMRDI